MTATSNICQLRNKPVRGGSSLVLAKASTTSTSKNNDDSSSINNKRIKTSRATTFVLLSIVLVGLRCPTLVSPKREDECDCSWKINSSSTKITTTATGGEASVHVSNDTFADSRIDYAAFSVSLDESVKEAHRGVSSRLADVSKKERGENESDTGVVPGAVARNHRVAFLQVGANTYGDVSLTDAFSASWWQRIDNFLSLNIDRIGSSPEGASFDVYIQQLARVRMTRNWLDLAVEHMSKWWKVLLYRPVPGTGKEKGRILDIFQSYIQQRKRYSIQRVPSTTLVVVAFMPASEEQEELMKYSLAATIASFVELGMGRIVVAGRFPEEKQFVHASFNLVADKRNSSLSFCLTVDARTNDTITPYNVPKAALQQVRHILRGQANKADSECWLGPTPKKWKYLFLGEPDLVLHIRPQSLHVLGKALEAGYVLAPHRLQPIPHESDFNISVKTHVLPAVGQFANVQELDSTWSCCDGGSVKPGKLHEDCGKFWWQCGFHDAKCDTHLDIFESHKRLLSYPLLRLSDGTRMPFVGAESGRRCFPRQGQCSDGNTSTLIPI